MSQVEATMSMIKRLAECDIAYERSLTKLSRIRGDIQYVQDRNRAPQSVRDDALLKMFHRMRKPKPMIVLRIQEITAERAVNRCEIDRATLQRTAADQVLLGHLLALPEWDSLEPRLGFKPSSLRVVGGVIRGVTH